MQEVHVEVERFEVKKADQMFRPRDSQKVYVASVIVTTTLPGKRKPHRVAMGFSRYDTEKDWYGDYLFVNGLPQFSHGEGSRCCAKQVAIKEVKAALDKALSEVEVTA